MRHTQEGKFEADKGTERRDRKRGSILIFLVKGFRNNESIADLCSVQWKIDEGLWVGKDGSV